uniref:Uncharacterized protein n=1 Tax=Physcomitrium patens TaxID=3218 RepID=A0A2K1K329_PHYPA|nr:hypothetical protein PHYPA_012653 [Physcomitrium patens]
MFSSHACFKCCLKSVHDIKEPGAAQISFIQYQFLGSTSEGAHCQWKEGGGNGGSGGDGFQPKYKQDLDPSGAGS